MLRLCAFKNVLPPMSCMLYTSIFFFYHQTLVIWFIFGRLCVMANWHTKWFSFNSLTFGVSFFYSDFHSLLVSQWRQTGHVSSLLHTHTSNRVMAFQTQVHLLHCHTSYFNNSTSSSSSCFLSFGCVFDPLDDWLGM